VALASAKPAPNLGLAMFELERFVNPLASLQGGIAHRDALIRRLREELAGKDRSP